MPTRTLRWQGYWLGFFAAISISATNVYLDLNDKYIKMSDEFLKRQRYFSIIELASKPFKASKGPPQFSNMHLPLTAAKKTIVTNGWLGVSSHHGIHGNDNDEIWVHNVKMRDFEVGGGRCPHLAARFRHASLPAARAPRAQVPTSTAAKTSLSPTPILAPRSATTLRWPLLAPRPVQ